uniref:Interleukin 34 n=1 Tax=Gouania willdenowi TaxID=441366 RepID=A0A8C5EZ61_GOUWI
SVYPSISIFFKGKMWESLLLIAPILMAPTSASMCTPLRTLNNSLSYRRRYMKHYFPINYTVRVHHEEIFKLSNISKMDGVDELVLQRLWFQVNQGVLKKIIQVLPKRHPSRSYTAELERRFKDAEGVFVLSHPAEVFYQELPETIQDIWDRLTEEPERMVDTSWGYAFPKSLLDNLCHTMYCLFHECFSNTEDQQDCDKKERAQQDPNEETHT